MRRLQLLQTTAVTPLLLALASSTSAQTPRSPQPLVVEQMSGGFLAPDDTFFSNATACSVVMASEEFKLADDGVLLGSDTHRTRRVRFGTRRLVDVAPATPGRTYVALAGDGRPDSIIRFGRARPAAVPIPERGAGVPDVPDDQLAGQRLNLGLQFGW
jgi:hypothetical protein